MLFVSEDEPFHPRTTRQKKTCDSPSEENMPHRLLYDILSIR